MVIRNFHIISVAVAPFEADSVLIIDPDAVLAPAITLEGFHPVTRQSGEISQLVCSIDHAELLEGSPDAAVKAPAVASGVQPLGFAILKRPDQV